jgi:hypothetical protein
MIGPETGGLSLVVGVMLAPIGAAIGAVGGVLTPGSGAWKEQEAGARGVLAQPTIHDPLRDRVLEIARARTQQALSLAERRPATPDERPVYEGLIQDGIQTVLEVAVETLALEGSGVDSPLGLTIRARARLILAADGAEIYAHTFGYFGREQRRLHEWAASDATLLQQELERAYEKVADKIVTDVFLLDPHSREIEEEASAVEVPEAVRQAFAQKLQELLDRSSLPGDRKIRYRFIYYDPGRGSPGGRLLLLLRGKKWLRVEARFVNLVGHEIDRVEAVYGVDVPLKAAIRKFAEHVAAYARSLARE